MSIKITPFGTTTDTQGAQMLEFNTSLPCGARTDIAPTSNTNRNYKMGRSRKWTSSY